MRRRTQYRPVIRKPDAEVSLPPAGRNTPAARAYSNARRAGRTRRPLIGSALIARLFGSHRVRGL